jgi:hypothetical protein
MGCPPKGILEYWNAGIMGIKIIMVPKVYLN